MHFTKYVAVAVAAIAPLIAPAYSTLTAAQYVAGIKDITSQSERLQPIANSISPVNTLLFVIGQGPIPVSFSS